MGLFILITALSMICASATAQATKGPGCTSDDDCMNNGRCMDSVCYCTTEWAGTFCDDQVHVQITDSSDGGGHIATDAPAKTSMSCHICTGDGDSECGRGWQLNEHYGSLYECGSGVYTCETSYWFANGIGQYWRGCGESDEWCWDSQDCFADASMSCRSCCSHDGCNTETFVAAGSSRITSWIATLVAGFVTMTVMAYL